MLPGLVSPKFATETHRPIQDNNGGDNLTSMCSQPLKDLARQFQVSSSFRVEKKISQATEELGLFPLTLYLNHLSHRPDKPLISIPEKPTVPLVRELSYCDLLYLINTNPFEINYVF